MYFGIQEPEFIIFKRYYIRKDDVLPVLKGCSWFLSCDCTWKCRRGCGSWGVFVEAGVTGAPHGRFSHGAALLRTWSYLADGVPPDARAASRGGVYVVLYYRGQHGNIVALRTDHRILDGGRVARFGSAGALQPLFYGVWGWKRDFCDYFLIESM